MTVVDSRRVRGYTGRRLGTVYCYRTWRPDHCGLPTQVAEVGYVGQTVQPLADRDGQHRGTSRGPFGAAPRCQPWSDLVVGDVSVVEQGWWRCDELLERELFHIRRLRPRYNHAGNLANPHRTTVAEARRQRQHRDRARGALVTTWPERSRPSVRHVPRRVARRVVRRAGPAAAIVVAVLILGPVAGLPWQLWLIGAAAAAGSPLAALPKRRDGRRLAALAVAVAALVLLALTTG